jgi:hypothetical protein
MNDVFTWPVGRDEHFDGGARGSAAPVSPVLAYAVATTVAGGSVGLLLGLVGAASLRLGGVDAHNVLIVLVVVSSLIAVLSELGGSATLLPSRQAQVPRRWLAWRSREATAIGFGLLIGSGALTPIRFASAYVLAGVVVLAPSPILAIAIGGAYGGARGSALLVTWLADRTLHRRIAWDALAADPRLNTAVALMAVACLTLVLVLGGI